MLIPTKTGFIEIVKEPQFKEIYTIKATDIDSAMLLRKRTRGLSSYEHSEENYEPMTIDFDSKSVLYQNLSYSFEDFVSCQKMHTLRWRAIQAEDKDMALRLP
jgi:hypothetical protein